MGTAMAEGAPECAITLQAAAERLGVSYQTVFARRRDIAFRLPGSRIWRVWPSALASLGQRQYNVTRLVLRSDKEQITCQSDSAMVSGGSIYARQAASELDKLLEQKTKKRPRNITTG